MNIADLTAFCRSWGELSQPFHSNNFVYATNGSLAIRIPVENFEGPLPENGTRDVASYAEKLDGYLDVDLCDKESHTLRNFDFDMGTEACTYCEGEGKLYACNECDGSGEVSYSTDYHDYENGCDSCNGTGYFSKSEWKTKFRRSEISYADTEECEECGGTGVLEGNPDIFIGGQLYSPGPLPTPLPNPLSLSGTKEKGFLCRCATECDSRQGTVNRTAWGGSPPFLFSKKDLY